MRQGSVGDRGVSTAVDVRYGVMESDWSGQCINLLKVGPIFFDIDCVVIPTSIS